MFKSGFVSIVGRPNVGKSTLMNNVVGEKIAIMSDKPQTTRNVIQGIYNEEDTQIIFVDTPGIHKAHNKLGRALNKQAYFTINDVDIIIMVVDITEKVGSGDKFVIDILKNIENKPVFLVINKIDKLPREEILSKIEEYMSLYNFTEVIPVSARKKDNIDRLIEVIKKYLPDNIKYFDENTQMSNDDIHDIKIKAIDEMVSNDKNSLFDYADNPLVVYVDKSQIEASYSKLFDDIAEYKESNEINEDLMYSLDDIHDNDRIYVNLFSSGSLNLKAQSIINYKENFEKLAADYDSWIKAGKIVYFYLSKLEEKKKLLKIIPSAHVVMKELSHGFILDKYVVISENDIEDVKSSNGVYKNNFHVGKRIKDFNQLEKGDYVVHISHGIGIMLYIFLMGLVFIKG